MLERLKEQLAEYIQAGGLCDLKKFTRMWPEWGGNTWLNKHMFKVQYEKLAGAVEEIPTEMIIQRDGFVRVWNELPETHYCLYHIPNEGNRSVVEAAQQAAQGLLPGIQDLHFLWDGVTYRIEVKDDTGTCSPAQKLIHAVHSRAGSDTYLCRTVEEIYMVVYAIIKKAFWSIGHLVSPFSIGGEVERYEAEYLKWRDKKAEAYRNKANQNKGI